MDVIQSGNGPESWAVEPVKQLKPYMPGKPISELEREYGIKNIIKLASNENPMGASPSAIAVMQEALTDLWLYPDGGGFALRSALADMHHVDPGTITLGNGSNDTLALMAEAFLGPGREAVFSEYAFAVYPIVTQATGATARIAPANASDDAQPLGHDLSAMLALVNENTRIVFIANPNNPTGTWLEKDDLYRFVRAIPEQTLVVIDEAYYEYGRPLGLPDASRWLREFPNLVVSRTFSKAYGLAGARVGYSLSSKAVAGLLGRLRQPFNVNSLALLGAEAALADQSFIKASVELNTRGIRQLRKGLSAMGINCPPSAGNFVLADIAGDAESYNQSLLKKGIIVRPVANYGLPAHLRITAGTEDQNQRFLEAMREVHELHAA